MDRSLIRSDGWLGRRNREQYRVVRSWHKFINWDAVVGLLVIVTLSASGWTAIGFAISRLTH